MCSTGDANPHKFSRVDNVLTQGGPAASRGAYLMMWQFQSLLAWCASAQAINLLFAGLCLWAAFGLSPRWMALLSTVLYVALAFV